MQNTENKENKPFCFSNFELNSVKMKDENRNNGKGQISHTLYSDYDFSYLMGSGTGKQ